MAVGNKRAIILCINYLCCAHQFIEIYKVSLDMANVLLDVAILI